MELTVIVLKSAEAYIEDFHDEEDFTDSLNLIDNLRENLRLWKEDEEED